MQSELQKNLPTNAFNIGVDIEEISRFESREFSSFTTFYKRIFTSKENEYCLSFKSPAPHFTSTFAGKEAVYKALNAHLKIKLLNIEILRNEKGEPFVNLLQNQNISPKNSEKINSPLQIKLSLSHSHLYAIAFAIVIF